MRLGIDESAAILVGGEDRPEGLTGSFVGPTAFTGVRNDMRIGRAEIFGPDLSIQTYRDDDAAVAIANETAYELCAHILANRHMPGGSSQGVW